MRLQFDDCLLDTGAREVRRRGVVVPLTPKAFRLLEVLVERRPNAVSQDELRRLLWPDTVLGGTTIARLVSELRAAIGDETRGRRVRTVHRFGYAFTAEMTDEEVPTSISGCAFQWGTRLVPLRPGENLIGRSSNALITVASPKVSRRHARVLVNDSVARLEDLGSRNGTYIGEDRIIGIVELKHGDRVLIGPALLIFCVVTDDPTQTATDTSPLIS